MARSPRWMLLKATFSSFQHLGLLQIPRLSNFKEICLQNSRIIVCTFFFFEAIPARRHHTWQPS